MNKKTEEVGKIIGKTIFEGLQLLGKSAVWTGVQVTNGSVIAGKTIAEEYKRQQKNGF